jgi:hypothetical protein
MLTVFGSLSAMHTPRDDEKLVQDLKQMSLNCSNVQ